MKNATQRIDAARTALAEGFTTKQAQKDAVDQVNRAWQQTVSEVLDASQRWNVDVPRYVHQLTANRIPKLPVALQDVARQMALLAAAIKRARVVKPTKEVDDTKVREAEVQDPLVFTDSKGDERGVCWCCGRAGFKLNKRGAMSRHGFQRPGWGYEIGGCVGSGMTPRKALAKAIEWTADKVERLDALLADDAAMLRFEIRGIRREAKGLYRSSSWDKALRRSIAQRLRDARRSGFCSEAFRRKVGRERAAMADHLERARRAMAQHQAAA